MKQLERKERIPQGWRVWVTAIAAILSGVMIALDLSGHGELSRYFAYGVGLSLVPVAFYFTFLRTK